MLAVDTAVAVYARMHGIGAVSLRYFNVAGAYQQAGGGWLGERHNPETHLIPNVLSVAGALARGESGQLELFGDDYPTRDGTCVRDYIHVTDLAEAHLLALGGCEPGRHRIYNLGSEAGFSNREVIEECQQVTGQQIGVRVAPRRPGDPATLVASSERIRADLGWRPERDLRAMVADGWAAMSGRAVQARVAGGR
jgi:UDP-glucose 4-epimerase